MIWPIRIFILVCLLVPTSALAHAPIMGIGGVLGGVLHAVLIPEHGLSLVALGLALGREQWDARRTATFMFAAALTCGLLAAWLTVELARAADVLLAIAGVLGILVAASWVPLILCWPSAIIVGVVFALDSVPEVASTEETIRMLIGSGIGAAIALILVAEGSGRLPGSISRVAVRVLASWIAAIAILDLSLRIATQRALGS